MHGARGATDGAASREADKAAFQRLRPLCVDLLRHAVPATDVPKLVAALRSLHACLSDLPPTLPLALIHYVFYPLSQLLHSQSAGPLALPDRVRELVFQSLQVLARDWWRAWTWTHVSAKTPNITSLSQPSEWKVWEQLLLLGTLALGGAPGSAQTRDRGSDETRLAVVQFLVQLLHPRWVSEHATPASAGADWEWDGVSDLPLQDDADSTPWPLEYPSVQHGDAARAAPAASGALAHLLKLSLDTARTQTPSTSLRVACLQLAGLTSLTWMAGTPCCVARDGHVDLAYLRTRAITPEAHVYAERLRPVLPGMVSALTKMASAGAPAAVVASAIELWAAALAVCLDDALTHAWRPAATMEQAFPTQLEQFAHWPGLLPEHGEASAAADGESEDDAASDVSDTTSDAGSVPSSHTSLASDATPAAWLERTLPPVMTAVVVMSQVPRDHAHTQLALVDALHTVLLRLRDTMEWSTVAANFSPLRHALRTLLDLADPAHTTRVTSAARAACAEVGLRHERELVAELVYAWDTLPAAIRRVDDAEVQRLSRRAQVLATLLSDELASTQWESPSASMLVYLSAQGHVERWGGAIVDALGVQPDTASVMAEDVPHWRPGFAQLESNSVTSLASMWSACGTALAKLFVGATERGHTLSVPSAFAVPLFHLTSARAEYTLHAGRAMAHLLAAHQLMLSLSVVLAAPEMEAWMQLPSGRAARKLTHALGRQVIQEILSVWRDSAEASSEDDALPLGPAHPSSDAALVRGFDTQLSLDDAAPAVRLGPAVDVSFVGAAQLSGKAREAPAAEIAERARAQRQRLRDVCDAYLLGLMASAFALLGVSGRQQLLHALYPVLSAMAGRADLVQAAARHTLSCMAEACAYPNVHSCVLHHTDYVLGAASHRLIQGLRTELYSGVAVSVPSASPYAGSLMSARSAPWVLVQVLQMLGAEAVPLVEDAIDEVLSALDQFHGHPDVCDGLLAVLARLIEVLAPPPRRPPTPPPAEDALASFSQWYRASGADPLLGEAADSPPDAASPQADEDDTPSSLQVVVAEILRRCIPFLSHGAAALRVRALGMLSHGVAILAEQQRRAELYPVLESAWPLVLARLGTSASSSHGAPTESDVNVWLSATATVGAVAMWASDAYGRRVVQQAWPRWRTLLRRLAEARAPRASLTAPSPSPKLSVARVRLYEEFSALGRMVVAVLQALTHLAHALGPRFESDALWSMLTDPMLADAADMRQPRAVREAAHAWWQAAAACDAMAVWSALRAMQGVSPPHHLRREWDLSTWEMVW